MTTLALTTDPYLLLTEDGYIVLLDGSINIVPPCTLLSVIQKAMKLCNLPAPSSAFTNTDATVQQFVMFSQDIGDEISNRYFWRNLNKSWTIVGDGTTTIWPVPSDYSQLSPGFQMFSSVYPLQPLLGPVLNEDLALYKAALVPQGSMRPVWRPIGGNFEIWPALQAGEVVTSNYYSNQWVQTQAPSTTTVWTSDSDGPLIDCLSLALGCVWRWKNSKGLDYAEDFRRYQRAVDRAGGRDNTDRVVRTGNMNRLPYWWFSGGAGGFH